VRWVAGQRRDTPRVAVVCQPGVHLVGDDVGATVRGGLHDRPDGVRVVHPTRRIGGRREDDRRRLGAHPLGQPVRVEREPRRRRHRHLHGLPLGQERLRLVVGPRRSRVEQFLARADDGHRRQVERLHPADRDDDLVERVLHPVVGGHRVTDGPPARRRPRVRRVVGRPVPGRRCSRVDDVVGRVEVRLPDLQADEVTVGRLREVVHHADARALGTPHPAGRLVHAGRWDGAT